MLDVYPLLRPLLFRMDPEKAHNLAIWALGKGLGPKFTAKDDPILKTKVCGLDFPNPIGLAAGFDKQAEVMSEILDLGFGFTEVGTVILRPQPGNPKPRLFRIEQAKGLINRFGWNSDGADVCARRLTAWRDTQVGRGRGIVGVNIGFNKDSTDPISDYIAGLVKLATCIDYAVISVSTPNSPGVRDLQKRETLTELLARAAEARQTHAPQLPLLLKISPDINEALQEEIADVVVNSSIQGMIVGNTSFARPDVIPPEMAKEAGGFSGPVMFAPTTKLLANMCRLTHKKVPLIGNCAIFTGADAYAKIRAGASLVQVYTALIYEGPSLVSRIKRDLTALLKRDGFTSVADAVGVDAK